MGASRCVKGFSPESSLLTLLIALNSSEVCCKLINMEPPEGSQLRPEEMVGAVWAPAVMRRMALRLNTPLAGPTFLPILQR